MMKQPSAELASMIKTAAENLISFGELWTSIKKKGEDEGFTEKELQDILRPLIKPKLNKDQVYYLFHSEEKKEASKKQYHRNIPMNDDKKEPEHRSPPPVVTSPKEPELDYEADYKKDMAKIEAIRAMPRPEPKFTKEDTDINTVVFRMGIEGKLQAAPKAIKDELADYADWIVKDLPMLQRRGWRAVEVTIRVVS